MFLNYFKNETLKDQMRARARALVLAATGKAEVTPPEEP